jgi:hypothetical protein
MFGIKLQHNPRDFTPVSTLRICVEQAQIRDDMLLVVIGGRGIGGHRDQAAASARNRLLTDQLASDLSVY